jgi:DNA excision repair protein ERCC-2
MRCHKSAQASRNCRCAYSRWSRATRVARDKACEHPDKACHGDSCPLAKGFYDRLPQARQAALGDTRFGRVLDKEALRTAALEHDVCPYYLSQDLARWCDVVVGDYNYYFDIGAMLHGLTVANEWRVGLLVDEAHNLVERARKMFTAEMDQGKLRFLRRTAPAVLKKSLDRLHRCWNELNKEQDGEYRTYDEVPSKFAGALMQTIADITGFMTDNPTFVDGTLQEFYFDALHFSRLVELFDTHSLFDISMQGTRAGSVMCIRNVVPAGFLEPRFAAAHTATLFSATLRPVDFYTDMLGLPEDTVCIDVESPFDAAQLTVKIAHNISTRYQDRDASLDPIAALVARQYDDRPGNYLAFFSSFDYLQKVAQRFAARFPHIPMWEQSRGMAESERDAFLARFTPDGRGVGFAVLGGSFGEGIDLPGDRLVGAFIATLGLPQLNPVNEHIMQRMQELFGAGYDYTYLYPGMQKVVQAAGRVIRTQSDRGIVVLIDGRFARANVMRLLPGWWKIER